MLSGAALRARELLAAKETELLLNAKERIRTPPREDKKNYGSSPVTPPSSTQPRRTAGQVSVRVESIEESSSRVKDILSSMREKRESFNSKLNESKTSHRGTSASVDEKHEQTPSGKPPRSSPSSEKRDDLTKKMNDSLKGKRERISKLLGTDHHHKMRTTSRSPHTVDTALTEDDSQSTDSCSGGSLPPQHLHLLDSPKSTAVLQEIQETFENEESSVVESTPEGPSTDGSESAPRKDENQSDHFVPIERDDSTTDYFASIETSQDEGESQLEPTEKSEGYDQLPAVGQGGDKRVSFDDKLFVIEEMMPPSIVHCTSFDSTFSRDRSLPGYAPDDLSAFIGASESPIKNTSPIRRRTSSWDGSDVDESEARKSRYASLVDDREKRVSLIRKLQQTYSELLTLHEEIECKQKEQTTTAEDESESSDEILDDESSCEFTDDSNTSGWISQDESNSKLDSLLQYMTSEDDDSYGDSSASQGRFSFSLSLSQTASNLDTLVESDETEEAEDDAREEERLHDISESAVAGDSSESRSVISRNSSSVENETSSKVDKSAGSPMDNGQEDSQSDVKSSADVKQMNTIDKSDSADTTKESSHESTCETSGKCSKSWDGDVRETKDRDKSEERKRVSRAKVSIKTIEVPLFETSNACFMGMKDCSTEEDIVNDLPGRQRVVSGKARHPATKEAIVKKCSIDSSDSKRRIREFESNEDELVQRLKKNPRGIVKRQVDKWEAARRNPKTRIQKASKPDPPVHGVSIADISHRVKKDPSADERDDAPNDFPAKSPPVESEEERKVILQDNNEPGTPELLEVEFVQNGEPERNQQKRLFIPRKISNKRCRASGGLFDLAKKTGISDSDTICIKSRNIDRPPEITAMNAEFNCGTQGSLYNLALQSGCKIDQPPALKRLKLPPLGGGKRRWLLKARGGHYHISGTYS